MRLHVIFFGICCALAASACSGDHPTHDEAAAACTHQMELGFWTGFEGSLKARGHDPADPAVHAAGVKALQDQHATPEWKQELDKCTDGYVRLATKAQIKCITAAKTADDAKACVAGH